MHFQHLQVSGVKTIRIINGINLDKLGQRDPEHYGSRTLAEIEKMCADLGAELGLTVECFQTNDETGYARLIKCDADFLILNPGKWTHFSELIGKTVKEVGIPFAEVHLSNVHAREPFRHVSVIAGLATARVMGMKELGYLAALRFARDFLDNR